MRISVFAILIFKGSKIKRRRKVNIPMIVSHFANLRHAADNIRLIIPHTVHPHLQMRTFCIQRPPEPMAKTTHSLPLKAFSRFKAAFDSCLNTYLTT